MEVDWSIILALSSLLSSCAALVIAFFTFLQYKKVYDPNLEIHSYPPFKDIQDIRLQKNLEGLRIRVALVNPGGVPITLMTENIEVMDQETNHKIEVNSRFTQPEWRPGGLYVSQLPWVIEKFAIYEKFIYSNSESLLNKDLKIRMKFGYEVKASKRKTSDVYLTWISQRDKP
mgnify:CR=1 FL=1